MFDACVANFGIILKTFSLPVKKNVFVYHNFDLKVLLESYNLFPFSLTLSILPKDYYFLFQLKVQKNSEKFCEISDFEDFIIEYFNTKISNLFFSFPNALLGALRLFLCPVGLWSNIIDLMKSEKTMQFEIL